jgi:hypothetical protein
MPTTGSSASGEPTHPIPLPKIAGMTAWQVATTGGVAGTLTGGGVWVIEIFPFLATEAYRMRRAFATGRSTDG